MSKFRMPSLGSDMEAGTLVEWLVLPGSAVKRGDVIAVVETQKGAIEIEVFENGIFEKSLVDVGMKVPVGTPLAVINTGEAPGEAARTPLLTGEKPADEAAFPSKVPVAPAAPSPTPPAPADVIPATLLTAREGLRASPAARRLAERSGVDLAKLTATGPNGVIVLADVAAYISNAPGFQCLPVKPAEEGASEGMRAAIAAAMAHSKREIPHYYLAHTIDLTDAEAFVAERNAGRDPDERLLISALFVKAVARAARKYPEFNGHCIGGAYKASPEVNVGIAINIRGTGLVAPAIQNADHLDLDELMAGMRDLVARARAGRFRSSEISSPTITVSNFGDRGVEALYGIIYPPQVAIVGFGKPVHAPRGRQIGAP
jgi:pyruvate dehydrogenase E2 component (dihydrolipoamide acetyltransferase)